MAGIPAPALEPLTQLLNYDDLPETWRVPEAGRFSVEKTLYDYQTDALQKAARALFLYYGKTHDWAAGESLETNAERKKDFADLYRDFPVSYLKKYESRADERNRNESQVFRILSDFIRPWGDLISYHNLINRMCFWMATGSGKTLVMVKLIEYLHCLQRHNEIPPHNMLILAPSEHLIGQIRRTVDEFNQSGLLIDLVPLREMHRGRQARLGEAVTVYYHRSDNISDVQKDALTDYRMYENGGKWFILLDEAHKGGKEDSKRQAYYAIMAREGFLFNFSATFTDKEDIVTTVKKYNLEEFIKNGRGKNIYLNEKEYEAFKRKGEEINYSERRKIVLKSLLTLGYVSMRVKELRRDTGLTQLYHLPLMLTLVNSVNTDIENAQNDLWAFFQILREIATGEIDEALFRDSKNELITDWENAQPLFGGHSGGIAGIGENFIKTIKVTDLREAVFLSRRKGALQIIRSGDNKELAFQLRNADSPFALIRIGDTAKWRNKLLVGYEETTTLQEKSFFDGLEKSAITILMGSRSFFESWDSNRPNVINFINIGGSDAKKFVVQSVGRGVRIEPLPNQRCRCSRLVLEGEEKKAVDIIRDGVQPVETLFLFATNRKAVKSVLEGLETERAAAFESLEGFRQAPIPKIHGREMPLLIPEYRDAPKTASRLPFSLSAETKLRFEEWLARTSDAVLAVRDGLAPPQIAELHAMVAQPANLTAAPGKHYARLPFLQSRLMSHLSKTAKISDSVRKINDEDIVHFQQIRAFPEHARELQEKIENVKQGRASNQDIGDLAVQLANEEITREDFDRQVAGQTTETFKDLLIKKLIGHYYLPVALGNEKSNYIQHIIKVESEVRFLNALEAWVGEKDIPWDAWMFSKLDESLDRIHIPYFDNSVNDYRRFKPDFVFWMCRKNEYRIVFVDPKGTEYATAYRKIDGYKTLFTQNGNSRFFKHRPNWRVSVNLLFYNPSGQPAQAYQRYWTSNPESIFAPDSE